MSWKYRIVDWHDNELFFTAKELYERVKKDSESDYGWVASATELVRVCNDPNFSDEYAHNIKILILNCFASLELKKRSNIPSYRKSTDNQAVYSCYNSLAGTEKKAIEARKNYLIAVINAVTRYHFEFPIHVGPIYFQVCEEWEGKKYNENCFETEIDFEQLIKDLHNDFDNTIRTAERQGKFKEEDESLRYHID